jgi:predicted RNA-binding Zn-ribbon protein involved in translation (DUF1610 family)
VPSRDDILARADEFADHFEHDYTPTVDTSTPEMMARRPPCPMCGYERCWWSTIEDDTQEYDCDRCKAHGRFNVSVD